MLASALFNGVFEVVAHDFPKEDAMEYVDAVCAVSYTHLTLPTTSRV